MKIFKAIKHTSNSKVYGMDNIPASVVSTHVWIAKGWIVAWFMVACEQDYTLAFVRPEKGLEKTSLSFHDGALHFSRLDSYKRTFS